MTPINEMRSKFNSLPPFLRALAVIVVLGVLGVTAGAFVYSYNALYAVGDKLQNTDRVAWIWPVLIDGQIVVANAGLALAAALNKPKGAMYLWVTLATVASIGFNVWHAGDNRVHWLIAAVAPITIEGVCFVGVKVLDWLMHALGRPTTWMLPEKQVGYLTPPQTTVVQLPDGTWGVPPGAFPGYGAGTFPPQAAQQPMMPPPTQQPLQPPVPPEAAKNQEPLPLNGQNGTPDGVASGGRAADQRAKVEAYLDALQAQGGLDRSVTGRQVAQATGVSLRTAQPILAEYKTLLGIPGNGNGAKPSRHGLRRRG
jgi:hypothetical protein